jgi:nucleoside-diphosphate-sugar epimerase
MKILLTGASGFVGQHVLKWLAARKDFQVFAVSRKPQARESSAIKWLAWDPDDAASIRRVVKELKPDKCLHLAWNTEPGRYLDDAVLNAQLLLSSTRLVSELIEEKCSQVIMLGTCAEYAYSPEKLREDSDLDPLTVYAIIKHALHSVAAAMCKGTGTHICWARLFHLYGPGEDSRRFVPSLLKALERAELFQASECLQVRDYLFVEDVAAALMTLMDSGAVGTFNICSSEPLVLRDLVSKAESLVSEESKVKLGALASRPWDPPFIVGDNSKLSGLGWRPEYTLQRGLQRYLNLMRQESSQ